MALGAWLLLFQSNLAPGGVGGPGGTEILTTHAPNTLALTGFHDTFTHEVAKENVQALHLGANGSSLIATEEITGGHTHEEGAESALLWRQIQTTVFQNGGRRGFAANPGTAPDEAVDSLSIEDLTETDAATVRLWLNPIQACAVVPRVKLSSDNPVTKSVHLSLYFYTPAGLFVALRSLVVDTAASFARQWFDFDSLDLHDVARDTRVSSRIPLVVRVAGYLQATGDVVAVHELAFGVVS